MRLTSLLGSCDDRGAELLAGWLSRELGRTVEVVVAGDWLERLEQLRAGDIDLALVCGGVVADSPELVPLVAPVYSGEGGPVYWSEWVVGEDETRAAWTDFRGARLAINEPESHSGVVHLKDHLRSHGAEHFFGSVEITGSHLASMAAVAGGQADVATIDSHVWAREDRRGLRSLVRLGPSPSPPVAAHRAVDEVATLRQVLAGLRKSEILAALGIDGYRPIAADGYQRLRAVREAARRWPLAR